MKSKLLFLVLAFTLGSCSIIKNKRLNREKSEVHHYHDSTHTIERLTTHEVKTLGDTTQANFLLEALLKSGYGKSVDRHFTTEVHYKDGNLQVITTMDSLIQRITNLERLTMNTTEKEDKTVDSKVKTKDVEVKDYTMLIFGTGFILLLIIIILAAIIYLRFLKSRVL